MRGLSNFRFHYPVWWLKILPSSTPTWHKVRFKLLNNIPVLTPSSSESESPLRAAGGLFNFTGGAVFFFTPLSFMITAPLLVTLLLERVAGMKPLVVMVGGGLLELWPLFSCFCCSCSRLNCSKKLPSLLNELKGDSSSDAIVLSLAARWALNRTTHRWITCAKFQDPTIQLK